MREACRGLTQLQQGVPKFKSLTQLRYTARSLYPTSTTRCPAGGDGRGLPRPCGGPAQAAAHSLKSVTGYTFICIKKRRGAVTYYPKIRLDLNKKEQTNLGEFKSAKEAAIFLATYLKVHPQVPKRKVTSEAVEALQPCLCFHWHCLSHTTRSCAQRKKATDSDSDDAEEDLTEASLPAWVINTDTLNLSQLEHFDESMIPKDVAFPRRR